MGLDSYAALPTIDETGRRTLTTDLPGRVTYAATHKYHDDSVLTTTRQTAFGFEEVPPLAGGIFSGGGSDGSFRGKCYSGLVEEVTGYSLYEDELPPPVVEKMALALRKAAEESPLGMSVPEALDTLRGQFSSGQGETELSVAYDLHAMACFFEACASQGYSVVSWY